MQVACQIQGNSLISLATDSVPPNFSVCDVNSAVVSLSPRSCEVALVASESSILSLEVSSDVVHGSCDLIPPPRISSRGYKQLKTY